MNSKAFVFSFTLLTLYSSDVLANPVSCERLVIQQVPETTHVQITWVSQCNEEGEMKGFKRDSEALKPDWIEDTDYSTNMGSGIWEVLGLQTCDCNVDIGLHQYVVEAMDYENSTMRFESSITVVKDFDPPEEPAPVEEDEDTDAGFDAPWDIPDPDAIQGLDCVKACATAGTGSNDGGEGDDDETIGSSGVGTTAGRTDNRDSASGCSIAGKGESNGFVLVIISFLLFVIGRRSRR